MLVCPLLGVVFSGRGELSLLLASVLAAVLKEKSKPINLTGPSVDQAGCHLKIQRRTQLPSNSFTLVPSKEYAFGLWGWWKRQKALKHLRELEREAWRNEQVTERLYKETVLLGMKPGFMAPYWHSGGTTYARLTLNSQRCQGWLPPKHWDYSSLPPPLTWT